MYNNITSLVKAFNDMLKSLFDYLKKLKEKQSDTAVLKEKDNLKTASDITERIFWLTREYFASDSQFSMWLARLFYDGLDKDEKRLFKRFYKQKAKLKKKIEKLQKEFEKVN